MRIHLQAVAALALATGTVAFAPATIPSRPAASELCMAAPRDEQNNNALAVSFEKAAMSFVIASVLAVSTATTVLPVSPAHAAAAPAPAVSEKQALAKSKLAKEEREKVLANEKQAFQKLSKEEREKILATKDLSSAQDYLKEYTKNASEAKSADGKAVNALKAQEKVVENTKKLVITDSDKLSAAKNQKMPASAIKELTAISSK
jgi:hypothetical protein